MLSDPCWPTLDTGSAFYSYCILDVYGEATQLTCILSLKSDLSDIYMYTGKALDIRMEHISL